MTGRIVVIGGDAAGMSAAAQARRISGDAVQIVAFERGTYSSYSACGIRTGWPVISASRSG